jgi:hypothetical protein
MNNHVNKAGFWTALLAFIATATYVIVQLLQLYGALYYPVDEILIYGSSLCIAIPFVLAMLALHYVTPEERKFWSHAALICSVMYAVFVIANYVVQLATVIPQTVRGTGDAVQVLRQTPHSMFWDFDAVGYILMGLAMLIALPALDNIGFHKWLRLAFLANGLTTPAIALVYFYPQFTYRLLILGYPWAITAPLAMLLLTVNFRKNIAVNRSISKMILATQA